MMGHGLLKQLTVSPPYRGVVGLSQGIPFRKFLTVTFPVVMVPPDVLPAASPTACVGTLPGPKALLNATNDCQLTVSKIRTPPPRSRMRSLPKTFQAKPAR